ncbi:Glycosyl transferase family 8 [Penicillium alfredii]|uniref:Glycosyl transferase family 8 n=1 Tax=Penicillium alfredii TaxID=1506179 RepID=A0A9W9KR14_9EURO|nr:Glycosyl transferase family 8 [Penicillium alfredii]KAJ5114643.1 Glycosyl transferase family 8 [Penicillium alfredii]
MSLVWASLITNLDYLPGLLTLHHSLYNPTPDPATSTSTASTNDTDPRPEQGSRYPFVALYTSAFPAEGLKALQARGIPAQWVPSVTPASAREYAQDPRFAETWTKLVAFSLEEYDRVVLLDGDILVRRNMDELMDLPLDSPATLESGAARRVFAAAHACACNPMKKPHYPSHWISENCAYTSQHPMPDSAQTDAPSPETGVSMLNSGVLVITPSAHIYNEITAALQDTARIERYDFPDQELLSEVFNGRWVAIPYVYNALKTLRWPTVHGAIWRDAEARAVHYIFAKKPWHEAASEAQRDTLEETSRWWWEANWERRRAEKEKGIEGIEI